MSFVFLLLANFSFAQTDSTSQVDAATVPKDSAAVISDTLVIPARQGQISTTIVYSCNDSIAMDIIHKKVFLYGQAKVSYEDLVLEAGKIEIDYAKNTVKASPSGDTTVRDYPTFKQGSDQYEAKYIEYNIQSKKGLVRDIVTQQGEGYIKGDPVKRTEQAVYVKTARYTTCNLEHPHYYISARKLKVMPEDKVVTGPFNIVVSDIPTPLGLPFGFFPITTRSKSGIIFPTIGNQQSRGFFLSQGGAYWAVSDRSSLQLMGDYYTNKSFRATLTSTYRKRYTYDGNAVLNYSRVKDGFDDGPFPTDFSLRWTHATLKKTSGKLSANVNITSNNYNRLNSYNPTSYQSSVFNSTVTYTKSFKRSPFNVNVAARQDQNVATKEMNLTLPELSFTMNRIYPLKSKKSRGDKWYDKINLAYTMNTKYSITNKFQKPGGVVTGDTIYAVRDNTLGYILSKGKTGMSHTIPIGTTLKVMKYFNLNPTLTLQEYWYLEKSNYKYNAVTHTVYADTTTIKGFTRAGQYNFKVDLTTRIYGTYRLNNPVVKGIRHTINPTVTYTYKPDFSKPTAYSNVYQQSSQVLDAQGNPTVYSRYATSVYGGPSSGVVNSIGFSLINNLEAKVRNRKDTTGDAPTKKVNLLESVAIAGSYNFAAKAFNLSNITLSARTRLFNMFDVSFNSSFDPYEYRLDSIGYTTGSIYQTRINTIKPKLSQYSLSIGGNFNPKAKNNPPKIVPNAQNEAELNMINRFPERYIDFKIPWSLSMNYSINYSKVGYNPQSFTQSLSANGNISLTEKWKLTITSGYDFVAQGLTYTTIGITRDLHCWQMAMTIVPFGARQSYFFTISAKSSILQDLKLTKRSPTYFSQ
ncbi:MAG: hypothetical protein JWO58_549 [Chitinophagaceae bacterium]|nr:hypothetical protein [Chitinophagaceae bacterium]